MLKRGVRQILKKTLRKLSLRKKHQNEQAINVDPDLHIHPLPQSARTSGNSVECSNCGGLSRMRVEMV